MSEESALRPPLRFERSTFLFSATRQLPPLSPDDSADPEACGAHGNAAEENEPADDVEKRLAALDKLEKELERDLQRLDMLSLARPPPALREDQGHVPKPAVPQTALRRGNKEMNNMCSACVSVRRFGSTCA
mmetsp:Transcript_12103/g.35075  ORF Transcript_12103/g.35075 Transcript_12103/m.35075 type:complete len:132 (+) Transcript_12103:62-457(+)